MMTVSKIYKNIPNIPNMRPLCVHYKKKNRKN